MDYYPVFLKLEGRKCLVIGGGGVAERKVRTLARCGADIYVVSPELTSGLKEMSDTGRIHHRAGFYHPTDLEDVFLVFCATDDDEINGAVAADCAARNIAVNVVDDPKRCSFVVPSVVHRGDFKLAISTGGNSPHLARVIRQDLETLFGPQFEEFTTFIGRVRKQVLQTVSDPEKRRMILNNLVDDETLDMLKQGNLAQAKERVEKCLSS